MKKALSLIFLLSVSAFVYKDWFTFKLFSYGDYVYYTKNALASYLPVSVWAGNFDTGGFDILFWRLPQYIVFALGANAGLEFNVVDRFVIFWPWIVLSVLPIYFLLSTLVKNEAAKILGALIFAFNTYFLSISTQGHLLISVASCFSIAAFSLFKMFLDTRKFIFVPTTSILLLLTTIYDLRITYVTFFLIASFLAYKLWVDSKARKSYAKIILGFFTMLIFYVAFNLFWVLPTMQSGGAVSQNILQRSLFGNEFLNILYSYSLFHPFWTGAEPSWFEIQKINPFAWFIPIFALISFMYGRKNVFIVFVGFITAVGIFLTKQASIPFAGTYEFLFDNLPGFGAFREASKFYFLVALGYSILIAYGIDKFYKKNGKFRTFSILIIVITSAVLIWNAKPVVTGEIGSLFVERNIPEDYRRFNEFINDQDSYFRIVWVPRPTRWLDATNRNPHVSLLDFLNKDWKDYRPKKTLELYEQGKGAEADIGSAFLLDPKSEQLLSSISAKYVVMPISDEKNADNIYKFLGRESSEIYESLRKVPYLKEINVGTTKLKVFVLNSYQDLITIKEGDILRKANFKEESSSEYKIRVDATSSDFEVLFSSRYDENWLLVAGDLDLVKIILNDMLYIKPVKTAYNTNEYKVSIDKICFQNHSCEKFNDGSKMTFTLFYKPQAYFIAGSIIAVLSFVLAVAMILVLFVISRYETKTS